MSETPPPRRPLATFLRATPAAPPLVPTPLVPPVEPPEQAIPAPGSALPPATPPPVDAQQAPRVPSPAAAVAASPHRATGTPGHDGFQAPVSGETQLPAPGTTMPSASATALAAGRVSDAMGDPPRPASAASDAHASDDGLAPIDAATDDALQDPTARTAPVPLNSAQQRALRASADADLPSRNAPGTSKALTETTARQVPTAAAAASAGSAAPVATAAAATQADTIGSERTASTPDGQSHPGRPSSHPDPATTEFGAASALAGEDAQCDAGIAQSRPSPAQLQPLPAPALAAPAFARRGVTRPRLRASGRQWALLVGLVGVLGLQIVIADRAHLATSPRWRPLISAACTLARCSVPAWREPEALTLLNRDVRPLPGVAGVLQIQASFRNDARWAQAWPWLQLSLSDADGRVIGTRILSPQDYLGQSPAAQDTLAPGQAVQVAFRVREPAASTAAFSFDFR
ncbi:DUF3426 domain-containing protein [Xanthomonas citri]|nr:DUF3426 domain-containing protein [Xanthomonas citri]MDS0759984.1 DUF3426 domain-containing protein [Xanthomonas citri pv. punicae]MDS0763761.1 DUF3426 domain-containing protein [Xanthomonas citri pv. punicae]MDS0798532.1 DUF3426 domain-containing protein [Xanthomonas citri pv. punicae]MDS0831159.1 DUF3426 domain-containing protein [Xanthomonas citri pv. punicae]MDS0834973.1 DUF3426 domain-containing protein [Xanthomonas citri pv. punicae]